MATFVRSRLVIRLVVLLAALSIAATSGAPAAATATKVKGTGLELLAALTTAGEHPEGYARKLFVHWVDADDDGCSTRMEVLIAESRTDPQVGDHCAVTGSWRSAYDGVITVDPGTFDIDHMVPLKEAWDSGAWAWNPARRQSFANDLGDWRSLRAVTAGSNRSKGDKDPAQWLPPRIAFRCIYAIEWVAVKTRWSLRVDAAERLALRQLLEICPTRTATVNVIPLTPPTPLPTPTPTPSPAPSATPAGSPTPPPPTSTPSPTPSPSPTPGPVAWFTDRAWVG